MAEKIKSPRMRLPRKVKQDDVFKVKVRFDHPSFTGLGRADTDESQFNRAACPRGSPTTRCSPSSSRR